MADINKTVQIVFAAEDHASATLNTLQKNGLLVTDRLQQSFETLGIKSAADMQKAKDQINAAFDSIKNSGVATAEEITRAESARNAAIIEIDKTGLAERKTLLEKFKEHWLGVTVAIGAATIVAQKAWALMSDAAQYDEQKTALNLLAQQYGTTADAIIASITRASNGQVSLAEAVTISSNALLKGLNPTQLEDFMDIATVVSNATGKSVSESFEGITTAVANGQEKLLKTQGIIVDLTGAWTHWADANGRTVDSLTEVEKQAISAEAVILSMADKVSALGAAGESTDDKMAQFTAMLADVKLGIGEALIVGVAGGVSALFGFSAAFNGAVGVIAWGLEKLFGLASDIPLLGAMFEPLESAAKAVAENSFAAAEDAAAKSRLAYDVIFDNAEKASSGIKKVSAAQDAGGVSASEYADAVKKYGDAFTLVEGKIVPLVASSKEAADALKKLDDEIFSAKKENVDDWTALAMEYNKLEVELRTAGVYDLTKVDEWYYIQADALRKKDSDASAKAQEEQKKKTEASIDQMMKFKLGLEEIQSKERVSIFDIQAKVDMAGIEASSKAFTTMFESIGTGIDSTSETLLGLFGMMETASTTPFGMEALLAAIEQEQALRQKEFDLQEKLIEAQINYMALKATALSKGEALINISADGLEPEIEAFMWQILKRIQTRANAEGAEYLLGI